MYWDKGHKTARKIAGFRTKEQRRGELLVFCAVDFVRYWAWYPNYLYWEQVKIIPKTVLSFFSSWEVHYLYISGTCEKKAMNWSVELFYFTLRKEYWIASFGSRESHKIVHMWKQIPIVFWSRAFANTNVLRSWIFHSMKSHGLV